jgi:hypothetical protein
MKGIAHDQKMGRRLSLALIPLVASGLIAIGAVTASAPPADPERDSAIAVALATARQRGDANPRIESVTPGRPTHVAIEDVPTALRGSFHTVTLTGRFDAAKAPPGRDVGRGAMAKIVLFIQDGRVVGGLGHPPGVER